MKAGESTIRELLEGTKQFIVPLFQRTYSWKTKHWETLWQDIYNLYEEDAEYTHFMGSIVSSPVLVGPEEVQKFFLIDGQQRLTTLSILLSVLRDFDDSENSLLTTEISESFLINRFANGLDKFKLLPTQGDRHEYNQILNPPVRSYHYRILGCYKFFRNKIKSLIDVDEKDAVPFNVRQFYNRVVGSLIVITITLDADDNPHLIFESLNAKGEPLTASDLIRNYIFMQIKSPEEQQTAYDELWLPMQQRLLNERTLTDFMKCLVMRTGVRVKRDDAYEKLRLYLNRQGAGDATEELSKAYHASLFYLRMIKPEEEANRKLAERFKTVLNLEVTTSHPLILRLYHLYADETLSEAEFLKLLDAITSFMIRRVFGFYSTRPLAALFVRICRELDETNVVHSVLTLLDQVGWPDDESFIINMAIAPIYRLDRRKTKFVLERIEMSFGHREPPDLTGVTIEHIFPQTPDEGWNDELDEQEFAELKEGTHTIGNLTLSAYNVAMSNKCFAEKQETYRESNLELNRYLANLDTWNSEKMKSRIAKLSEKAVHLWPKPEF